EYDRIHYLEGGDGEGGARGKIDFVLHGFKLRGRFGLAQTKQNGVPDPKQWLLLKKVDPHARPGREVTDDEPHSVLSGLTIEELPRRAEVARTLADRALSIGARGQLESARDLAPMRCAESGGRLDDPKC